MRTWIRSNRKGFPHQQPYGLSPSTTVRAFPTNNRKGFPHQHHIYYGRGKEGGHLDVATNLNVEITTPQKVDVDGSSGVDINGGDINLNS